MAAGTSSMRPASSVCALVLVADDDPDVRALISRALQHAGFAVREAANGREAVAIAHESEISLAIVDLVMPEKDGLQTIQELRVLRPSLPILAISGALPARLLEVAGLLGAHSRLAKPFDEAALIASVSKLLGS